MKINLEKACIGFLIGILLFCVCNKMFLIEGVTMNTCRDNKCNGNEGCENSCNSDRLCFSNTEKVCVPVNDPDKCGKNVPGGTGSDFTWCGSDDTPFDCAEAISNAGCMGDQKNPDGLTECAECSERAVGTGRANNECKEYIMEFCAGVPTPPSPPAPGPTPPSPPTPPAPTPPAPTPPSPPSQEKFKTGKITMEIVNNYGFDIMLFMRANNDWASSVEFNKQVNSCDKSGDFGCEANTRYIILNHKDSLIMTFNNSTVIESFKAWFIRDLPKGTLVDGTPWRKKGSAGPQPGTTDFEFNLLNGNIDANISYVDGINSKMDFYIYKNNPSNKIAENICDFSEDPPLSQDFQRYNILGMPVIFASKYSLPGYPNNGSFKYMNKAEDWADDKVLPANKLDGCGGEPGTPVTNTEYQNSCRRHMAEKIQDPTSYCGYLMKAGCPYCWGLGEFYCVDPDEFNNSRGKGKTCGERIIEATQGPKALGCGYNVGGINHFNWPNSVAELGPEGVSTEPDNYSMGSKPFDTPQYMDPSGGGNYSKYWYNTKPGTNAGPADFINKRPSDLTPLTNCDDDDSNWNFGAMETKSLNSLSLGNDAYYFRVEINSISWLRL